MEAVSTIFKQIRTLVLPLSAEQRLELIQDIASLAPVVEDLQGTSRRSKQLASEQASWYALPLTKRARYSNQYVAVKNGQIVDHDAEQRALYLRVRRRFGPDSIAILRADSERPPTFDIRSPRLER
jgi:hypothetical protein